ncbi:type II secretion system protein GspH [Acidovorax sp. Root267]|uniref:pilus assembly FimT family protein n=1 Tax=Acidovorax sp. Root267 TaxID=1736505 RepID=UPI000709419C|nr:GspH/FimT family pseudopilin [Acidovorax sp. Root267]KRD16504.1 type II secretion system protein GspH [Acidovorax sp. Root267]
MRRCLSAPAFRSRGFTLLELLVVLVLAAITVSVVGAGGQAFMERSRYNQTVRDVSSQLNKARALSVQEGRSVTVTYQPGIRKLVVDGRESLGVPESLVVQWEAIERNPRSGKGAAAAGEPIFVFNSDGGARGGRLAVLRGGQGVTFRVNWLLGTVEQGMAVPQS